LTVAGLLEDADTPLRDALDYVGSDTPDELVTALQPVARGDTPKPNTLETSGYVVHSLQTALHNGLIADSAEDAIVTAVNHGGDTDTIGAIAGAIAGARFGSSALPDQWIDTINEAGELELLADQLVEMA
ncbi:MAG: ADP-ribosylglycohydrolase, partial [Haloquadratum walsbyi J07HQW1]